LTTGRLPFLRGRNVRKSAHTEFSNSFSVRGIETPFEAGLHQVKSGFDTPGHKGILDQMKSLSDYSLVELRWVIALKEKIEALHGELEAITGEVAVASTEAPASAKRAKRKLSAAHKRKLIKALARARKMRWAKAKAASAPKKRRMSKAGRAAISAAAKARWAKVRAAKAD
jgi:hypothetical protein